MPYTFYRIKLDLIIENELLSEALFSLSISATEKTDWSRVTVSRGISGQKWEKTGKWSIPLRMVDGIWKQPAATAKTKDFFLESVFYILTPRFFLESQTLLPFSDNFQTGLTLISLQLKTLDTWQAFQLSPNKCFETSCHHHHLENKNHPAQRWSIVVISWRWHL